MQVHILEGTPATPMSQSCSLSSCTADANLSFAADGLHGWRGTLSLCILPPGTSSKQRGNGGCIVSLLLSAKLRSRGEMCDITSPDSKDTKRLGFPWCDRSETQRLSGQHPFLAPHGVSAAAHHPEIQHPCVQLPLLAFLPGSQLCFEEGYGDYYNGGITAVVATGCAGACAKGTYTSLCSWCSREGSRSFLFIFFFLQSGCLQEEMKA